MPTPGPQADIRTASDEVWPELPYPDWKPTLTTLHMWLQIVGKVKLELTPFLNHWWNVTFGLTTRGLSTFAIPLRERMFQVEFDFIDHRLTLSVSDGRSTSAPLRAQSVAEFYAELMEMLHASGIDVTINTHPVEVDNHIPFDEDHVHVEYDPAYVNRCWRILSGTSRLLERYRTPFVGKSSPVQFWWGSFDLSATRYSGRRSPPREWPARWMAVDAGYEYCSVGFWPGNDRLPEPAFFGYTSPEPPGCRTATLQPDAAYFHPELSEFVLPYERVRQASDPDQLILDFFHNTYEIGARLGDWPRAALERPDPILIH